MKVTSAVVKTLFLSLICQAGMIANTSAQEKTADLFGTPFDMCFEHGYNVDDVTQQQAFATAQCFTTLLETGVDPMVTGASEHTIRQYATSWYSAAADKGHALALAHITRTLIALNQLEQSLHSRVTDAEWQLLAQNQSFVSLDTNRDGFLSADEAAQSSDIQLGFSTVDMDKDGLVSIAEYTIKHGEATAAGQQ
ncbi:MAG: hypothetical protein R3183_07940 [Oleiphilaceae bacterium]|nr:hypothetical protein [Oleiphilaceae bacterium]